MTRGIGPEHNKAVRQERVVGTAINALLPAAIIWILDVPPPQRLIGPHDILAAIVPASGMATLVMTLILTLIIRARVAKGSLPGLVWPRNERGMMRFIPQSLLLRAVVLGLLAMVLLVPTGFFLVAIAGILPFSKIGALVFNVLFGALVGIVMTRFVVLPALADGRGA